MRQLKKFFIFFIISIAGFTLNAEPEEQEYSILILHSYHKEFYWTETIMEGINNRIHESPLKIELIVEYMDYKRYPNLVERPLTNILSKKFATNYPDAVIVSDNAALDFALNKREILFPESPIIFCGINGDIETIIQGRENVTGIAERWDPANTLKLIEALQPEVKKVLLFHDYTPSGMGTLSDFNSIKEPFMEYFSFVDLPLLPIEDIITIIQSYPQNTALLLLGYNRDSKGLVFNSDEIAQYLVDHVELPIYTMDETRFVSGIVGGSLLSGRLQGEIAADITLNILQGSSTSEIPPVLDPQPHLVIDYKALSKFNIPLENIPESATLINQPQTFYGRYKSLIWAGGLTIIVLLFLSITLIINLILRRRSESERLRLIAILEATTDVVSMSSMDQTVIYMNKAGIDLLGRNPVGNKIPSVHPPGFYDYFGNEILPILEQRGSWNGETRLKTKEGSIPVSQVIIYHRGTSEKDGYLSTIMRDITLQKKNEEQLRQSEENLRITLDSLDDGVFSTDQKGIIVNMNPAGESITGWAKEEGLGCRIEDLIQIKSNRKEEILENPVSLVLTTGLTVNQTDRKHLLLDKLGQIKNIDYSASPIMNQKNQIVGAVLVLRDITEELKLQDQLTQSQKMESIGQLAGGIAHDFNNLLTAILGTAEILEQSLNEGSEEKEYATDIISASLRARELTSHLLSFSRKGHMQTKEVHFHNIIHEVVHLLSRSIDKQIQLVCDLKAPFDVVMGDPVALQSAVLNLAINSRDALNNKGIIAFTTDIIEVDHHGGLQKEIAPGTYLFFSVNDDGHGMSREIKTRIFEPYFTTKPTGKGTGLGLAAVYGSIKSHKGYIQVYSEIEKGSSFHIYLPLAPGKEKEIPVKKEFKLEKGTGHILLIDDEDILRNTATDILKNLGYNVSSFDNGMKALEFLRSHKKDISLVILDLIMPRISGTDTFYLLKDIDPRLKILLSSGFSQHKKITELLDAGAAGFIQKPYRSNELAAKVWEILHSSIDKKP